MQLKYHIQTIGIEPTLINNAIYEQKCLEKQKKYKQAGKCYNQQQFKYILEAAMVFTPEGLANNSTISPTTSTPVKKPSARKLLCMFTNILEAKKKTACRRVRAAKCKRKAIKFGNTPWASKQKKKEIQKLMNK